MSVEQLDRIERRLGQLDELVVGQRALRIDVSSLKIDVGELKTSVARLEASHDLLNQKVHVLHEDTMTSIRDLAPDFGPVRREFKAADAQLREDIERRLEPLTAAVKNLNRS